LAELWIEGTIEEGGVISAGLTHLTTSEYQVWGTGPVNAKIKIPIQLFANDVFLLTSELGARGGEYEGEVSASAVLRFSGLPTAYEITSCQNYNLPVQVLRRTWGQLKAIYR
jgi:hypothetical protein